MTGKFEGKTAIFTGAGRGIGRGIARAYEGAKVVIASRTQATVDSVTREIGEAGGTAIGITLDVGDRTQINGMLADTREAFGLVSVLVNNAQSWGKPGVKEIMPPNTPIESIEDVE